MTDIISAFKGLRAKFRKKSKDKSQNITPSSTISTANLEAKTEKNVETPQYQEPLKLPPMRQLRESSSYSCHKPTLSVDAGLKTNASLRMPRSMSTAKNRGSKREDKMQRKREKSKTEDLIWQKTIILGEKCRVPDEDHDDVLYDDKGHKIYTFHPKTPRSLPPSRTGSFIDPKAIPSHLGWCIGRLSSSSSAYIYHSIKVDKNIQFLPTDERITNISAFNQ